MKCYRWTRRVVALTLLMSGSALGFAYDRDAVVAYGDTWWNKRNPAYEDYDPPPPTDHGDCANFASQCLAAGGINFKRYRPTVNKGEGVTCCNDLAWHMAPIDKGSCPNHPEYLRRFAKTILGGTEIVEWSQSDGQMDERL